MRKRPEAIGLEITPAFPSGKDTIDLHEARLAFYAGRVLQGGYFFFTAQAEFDDHPGAVRSRVAKALRDGETFIRRLVEEAVELGGHVEPVQVYFDDLDAMGLLHNFRYNVLNPCRRPASFVVSVLTGTGSPGPWVTRPP